MSAPLGKPTRPGFTTARASPRSPLGAAPMRSFTRASFEAWPTPIALGSPPYARAGRATPPWDFSTPGRQSATRSPSTPSGRPTRRTSGPPATAKASALTRGSQATSWLRPRRPRSISPSSPRSTAPRTRRSRTRPDCRSARFRATARCHEYSRRSSRSPPARAGTPCARAPAFRRCWRRTATRSASPRALPASWPATRSCS